jgi:hypothetical protein
MTASREAMRIEVLTFEGCPSGDSAWELARRVAAEVDLALTDMRRVEITSDTEAQEHRFLGSPSIHVNGEDIESARRGDARYAITCRVYRSPEGSISGVPPATMIREAIQRGLQSEGNDARE